MTSSLLLHFRKFQNLVESSRILLFWTSEEASNVLEQIWMVASWAGYCSAWQRSLWRVIPIVTYLCAKFGLFGALNLRIKLDLNLVKSSCNQFSSAGSQILYSIDFCLGQFAGLFQLVMLPRASGTFWTTVYMSPLTHIQIDFEAWGNLKLALMHSKCSHYNVICFQRFKWQCVYTEGTF